MEVSRDLCTKMSWCQGRDRRRPEVITMCLLSAIKVSASSVGGVGTGGGAVPPPYIFQSHIKSQTFRDKA